MSSRPSETVIDSAEPRVEPFLAGMARRVTFFPIFPNKSCRLVPFRLTLLGEAPSNSQVVTLPLASVTSTYTHVWGFSHWTFVSTPVISINLVES